MPIPIGGSLPDWLPSVLPIILGSSSIASSVVPMVPLKLSSSNTGQALNAMELTAVIEALKALKQAGSSVQLFSDSNYVVRGVNEWMSDWLKRGWKNARGEQVANLDLWQQLKALLEPHTVTLTWIPRGQNAQADELAQSARLAQGSGATQKPLDDAGSEAAPTVSPQAVSEIHIMIA